MSIRDILSNHKPVNLYPGGQKTASTVNTSALDLSLGGTLMFHTLIQGDPNLGSLDSVTIQYADDEAFLVNVVNEPVDVDGISILGNSVYNMTLSEFTNGFKEPSELISKLPIQWGEWALQNLLSFIVNVVNPFNSTEDGAKTRYCRLQLGFTPDIPVRIVGTGYIGPVRYKNSDGGIA